MNTDPTIPQGGADRRLSQEMSRSRSRPPTDVPGYDPDRLLGAGAFGEVWVAVERNTGRRVAIKFYTSRGGLDWSLLSREVEKLAFLFADRYIVQLIAVGWDADPPYYIMEYMERGSLADRLESGPLPVDQAVSLIHDIAVGLLHAHGKGVLHCDLKPANVLLDQDAKPRLADFGQSRLTHEQMPALGTLFHMAPEQADMSAVPDARWDVYALGSLLYCMLTGTPPHRDEERVRRLREIGDLDERLRAYRHLIREDGVPLEHRYVRGVDRGLSEIVERCLDPNPERRFPNVQSVLAALESWSLQRARRPLVLLGFLGPLLLLAVVSLFAWRGFDAAVRRSGETLTLRALENNRLTAEYVAGLAGKELRRRHDAVEFVADDPAFQDAVRAFLADESMQQMRDKLNDPYADTEALRPLREEFRQDPRRVALQEAFETAIPDWMAPPEQEGHAADVASWFYCDDQGLSVTRAPLSETIGRNYGWRSFYTGLNDDLDKHDRLPPGEHIRETTLSAVFRSEASGLWIVAVTTPVFDNHSGEFLGVVALTVQVNRFVELRGTERQFPVLVELRPGSHRGMILQHPLFDQLLEERRQIPQRLQDYRLPLDRLPPPAVSSNKPSPLAVDYQDPLAEDRLGQAYDRPWLAQTATVRVDRGEGEGDEVGWAVIVQEAYRAAIEDPLNDLKARMLNYGLAAMIAVGTVLLALWGLALRMLRDLRPTRLLAGRAAGESTVGLETPTPAEGAYTPNAPGTPSETHTDKPET